MSTEEQKEKLRQYFAKRVTTQARVVLDHWQKLKDADWQSMERMQEMQSAVEKLEKYADRFSKEGFVKVTQTLTALLAPLMGENASEPTTQTRAAIDEAIQELNKCTQRRSDKPEGSTPRTFLRTPIYLALINEENAQRITRQLEFFGFRALHFKDPEDLIHATHLDKPETIVIDVNFGGAKHQGIQTIQKIQATLETAIPIIFTSDELDDIQTRLMASRCGGEEYFFKAVDPGQLIERIEQYTHAGPQDPYRVLVVDDSRSQAKYVENVLTKAGIIPCVITDPMQILISIDTFGPEIVILDMYMPGCTGMELARVIRQQDRYHSVPIIYLSAEDDVNKQLHAMSLGGDDFLTKPINPRHLTATIHNRGRRARSLLALMIRDSLTGLYNHTHTLHLLETEIGKAHQKGHGLAFAMLDIDYFKKINDTYGHPIGDRVLKSLAMFLKQRLRKTDHIGRYGGEEFAIVLPNISETDARNILNEIRERFSQLVQPVGDREFFVTFSCGVAMLAENNAQELCEKADKALYEGKHGGRNQVRVYRE